MADEHASGGWSTIESDEGVFTSLIEQLGVKGVQFSEIFALDPSAIRALSPVYGVIFLFKYIGQPKDEDQQGRGQMDPDAVDESGLFFAAQTIQNACGTQAILSVILNNDNPTDHSLTDVDSNAPSIDIGTDLKEFKEFTTGFPADLRGEALSNSDLIRETHNSFAKSSPFADETQRDPSAGTEDVFHFIGYTTHHGTLYELDGLQPFPISHGPCTPSEFPDKIIPVLQSRIARYPAGEVRFNLMAVCRDLRINAEAYGDMESLAIERRKRAQWDWENALRRHNFVGFTGEMLKGVVSVKVKEGKYEAWIEEAKKVTEKRMRERQARARAEESGG